MTSKSISGVIFHKKLRDRAALLIDESNTKIKV
jgi:hypothetical protein